MNIAWIQLKQSCFFPLKCIHILAYNDTIASQSTTPKNSLQNTWIQKSAIPYARANAIKIIYFSNYKIIFVLLWDMIWAKLSFQTRDTCTSSTVDGRCWCVLCSPFNVQCFDAKCLWCAHESTCQRLKWHEASFLIHYSNLSFIHYNRHYGEKIIMWKWWRIYIL